MMIFVVLHFAMVIGVCSQEEFYKKYAFTKVMTECLGSEVYYGYLQQVANARRECGIEAMRLRDRVPITRVFTPINFNIPEVPQVNNVIPTSFSSIFPTSRPGIRTFGRGTTPSTTVTSIFETTESVPVLGIDLDVPFGPRIQSLRQKRAIVYSYEDIHEAQMRVEEMIGNFTCVLKRLGVISNDLALNFDSLINNIFTLPITGTLQRDLVVSLENCRDKTLCFPVEKLRSPVPHQLQRLIEFVKCEKEGRFAACLKHDLRKNLDQFDLKHLPRFAPGSDDAETLLSLLVGAESAFELELI
ncbi:hypothetical protein SK128_007560 [Halocaridina rubra]|uniref:Uncharacterized protein n=1 Tax=Halocaridina rubra TaxID=373956 RepID=A0AAN8XB38_HALRR